MAKVIESIAEAFSMQPDNVYVGKNLNGSIITEIKQITLYINGDPFDYYAALDKDSEIIAEYPKQCVSVHYKMVVI